MTIDGDVNTYWHTQYSGTMPGFPHWLAFDMKKNIYVALVQLTARQSYYTADATAFTVQKSDDGENWTDCESFGFADVITTQSFALSTPVTARYIRVYEYLGPNSYTHLSEFSVLGYEVN